MNTQTQSQSISLTDLEETIAKAAVIGAQLVADKYHGQSQFATSIRSVLAHAGELVALQKQWASQNPAPSPVAAPQTATPAPAPIKGNAAK